MVDVGEKPATHRIAVASGRIRMRPATFRMVAAGRAKKGDVLGIARIAAIQAAKKTPELVPLCHPIAIHGVEVDLRVGDDAVYLAATVRTADRTGVEMEALTAASVAALTVYDMVKGVERGVEIRSVHLVSKSGGQSGEWHRPADRAPDAAGRPPRRPGDRVAGRIRKKG